ncbi:MAG: DUF1343 domain-containing protein [Deltaproteobacteria bacterium]|nr:DUF1343 domain-containing protein [Deltaproteobacteria bacterium]
MLEIGLDVLLKSRSLQYNGKRFGLLSNQASVNRQLVHGRILLQNKFAEKLCCLFSPQHGFFSEKQDNMVESEHQTDPVTGLPIYSLYGEHRRPTAEMFDGLDVLLVDLVDVGTRVYTFLYTMAYCMERAAECGKKIVVLDRPNPIGGEKVEGNILQADCRSFVGLYALPMRHGLTLGELALWINGEYEIGADLEIVKMQGWDRSMLFRDTGYPWVSPSPNMPTPETAMVYPGQVLWEGTDVSEGRGTTLPFEFVGAPYWSHREILEQLDGIDLAGCLLRQIVFEPTSGKYGGESCTGFQIHVTNSSLYQPYRTSLALLQAVLLLYPEKFSYKEPPYEYEFERLPLDLILGDKEMRLQLEDGVTLDTIEAAWQEELRAFELGRAKYFLY